MSWYLKFCGLPCPEVFRSVFLKKGIAAWSHINNVLFPCDLKCLTALMWSKADSFNIVSTISATFLPRVPFPIQPKYLFLKNWYTFKVKGLFYRFVDLNLHNMSVRGKGGKVKGKSKTRLAEPDYSSSSSVVPIVCSARGRTPSASVPVRPSTWSPSRSITGCWCWPVTLPVTTRRPVSTFVTCSWLSANDEELNIRFHHDPRRWWLESCL